MTILRARTHIQAPPSAVWKVFVDPTTWDAWYGGDLRRVDPGWTAGAAMQWGMGSPSRLVEVVEREKVVIVGSLGGGLQGPTTTWTFAPAGTGTDVEVAEDFTHSASYASDPAAVLSRWQGVLRGLRQFVETGASPVARPSPRRNAAQGPVPARRKGCLIVGGLAAVLLVGACLATIVIVATAMQAEQQEVRAEAQNVLRLIGDGRTSDAYTATAMAYRAEADEAAFVKAADGLDVAGHTGWEEKQLRNHNRPEYGWTLEGYATGPGGRVEPVTMEFVKEGGKWKLRSIRRSAGK